MFGGKKAESPSNQSANAPSSNSNNILVVGTKIEGKISAGSDMRLDGELIGDLTCSGKLIIGPEGKVIGNIKCQNAVIEGTFEGNLEVAELLNIRETAKIQGDITTDKLIVQSGAIFNVTCKMGQQNFSKKS